MILFGGCYFLGATPRNFWYWILFRSCRKTTCLSASHHDGLPGPHHACLHWLASCQPSTTMRVGFSSQQHSCHSSFQPEMLRYLPHHRKPHDINILHHYTESFHHDLQLLVPLMMTIPNSPTTNGKDNNTHLHHTMMLHPWQCEEFNKQLGPDLQATHWSCCHPTSNYWQITKLEKLMAWVAAL